ncbi:hypothetical protein E2562_036142 [Oryza meyeriana var. granulata]|uniref:Uncharacterized protein n=1 Tax=Oryza meyeriana var. granulata TaxID=110450 RepID=A0A6G1E7A6_9ORYZ|nr:hypothetical protein E2562_036142 [Oryza meyeriana var. granulata]
MAASLPLHYSNDRRCGRAQPVLPSNAAAHRDDSCCSISSVQEIRRIKPREKDAQIIELPDVLGRVINIGAHCQGTPGPMWLKALLEFRELVCLKMLLLKTHNAEEAKPSEGTTAPENARKQPMMLNVELILMAPEATDKPSCHQQNHASTPMPNAPAV